jgi:hypothetical protein
LVWSAIQLLGSDSVNQIDHMKPILCDVCNAWISKANIARHRKKHGQEFCLRCTRKQKSAKKEMAIHLWFQSYQNEMLASEVLNKMLEDSDPIVLCTMSPDQLEISLISCIYHLEYFWLLGDICLYNRILNLVLSKVDKIKN